MDTNFSKQIPSPSTIILASPRRVSLFEPLILLAIGILFFWFIASPKSKSLAEKKVLVRSLTAESAKLADQQMKLESLISQLDSSSRDLEKLDKSLPLHPRTTWVYLLVEDLVQSSGMAVSTLTVSNLEDDITAGDESAKNLFAKPRKVKKVAVNLSTTGNFSQFEALLKKFENNGRLMDVKVLEINSSLNDLLDFRISFETYYFGVTQ